jgi:hypothetical protein
MANIIDGEEILHQAYRGILGDVITNISGDTRFMKDTDLLEDRNKLIYYTTLFLSYCITILTEILYKTTGGIFT